MSDEQEFLIVHEGGEDRKLNVRPVDNSVAPTTGHTFGETPTTRLIPRDQWKEVDLSAFVSPIKNQNGIGACNPFSTVNALEACRRMKGLPEVLLSPGDLYSRINGGRDNGSLPEDALKICLLEGVATAASVPQLNYRTVYNSAAVVEERKKYKFLEALWCPTFDHVASALQQGFFIDLATWWYGQDSLDAEGWLATVGGGRRGGHAYMGCGLKRKSNGTWGVKFANTWDKTWGVAGFGHCPEGRLVEGSKYFRMWALREVVHESGDLPVPVFPS